MVDAGRVAVGRRDLERVRLARLQPRGLGTPCRRDAERAPGQADSDDTGPRRQRDMKLISPRNGKERTACRIMPAKVS